MPRTPLQQLGDMLGMYAYLAAVGGLRYWPGLRRAGIEEILPAGPEEPAPAGEAVIETAANEYDIPYNHDFAYDPGRERMPAV